MVDIEKYTLLSKRALSKENIEYIITNVHGAGISWVGDVSKPLEIDAQGNTLYSFFCTKLTPKNKLDLQKHGLELKFVQIN